MDFSAIDGAGALPEWRGRSGTIGMIEFVHNESDWTTLKEAWNGLLARSAADYPFLRWEYQRAWWKFRGGGELAEADLWIGLWRQNGALRGIAPLFRTTEAGAKILRLIGSREISDYLDLIAAPEDLDEFGETLLAALADQLADWDLLDLHNLHASSRTADVLAAAAQRRGWRWERQPLEICPAVRLPSTWEEYLDSLDKKQRHEIRRKLRRAEAETELGAVALRMAGAGERAAAMDDFMRLMAMDPRKAAFLTPVMRDQFHALAEAAEAAGMLQLAFLEVGGRRAAGFFNFDYRDRIWVYNSGMDPAFAALSPGWVLLALLLQDSIRRGRKEFDFLRGNEGYKFLWGGAGEPIARLMIHR
jgi:CelD/BcsL family acetyltransferase involved in cellulose biosynthesis